MQQSNPTQLTKNDFTQLIDYLATNLDAKMCYYESDMVLYIYSYASYLSETKVRSSLGGHLFLSSWPQDPNQTPLTTDPYPPNNGAVNNNSTIMNMALDSAAEAEFGAVFFNMADAVPIQKNIEEMVHPKPSMHVITDNTTTVGIATKTAKQRWSNDLMSCDI